MKKIILSFMSLAMFVGFNLTITNEANAGLKYHPKFGGSNGYCRIVGQDSSRKYRTLKYYNMSNPSSLCLSRSKHRVILSGKCNNYAKLLAKKYTNYKNLFGYVSKARTDGKKVCGFGK